MSESEAQAALLMATRIMQRHNTSQADVLAALASDSKGTSSKVGGCSIVVIRSTTAFHRVVWEGFVAGAAHAMDKFFDCKSYNTKFASRNTIEWTFYGIAKNTVAAAVAFEMVHNLIVTRARGRHGRSSSYSYSCGIADGLYRAALEEKKLEEQRARNAQATSLQEQEQTSGFWESEMQLVRFRETAETIANKFLCDRNISLRCSGKHRAPVKDQVSYAKGERDSKKIDVRRKRIEPSLEEHA